MNRKALKPFTFSDGTHIPVGVTVSVASRSLHLDEDLYPNAKEFNAFRFSDKADEEGEGESMRHQIVNTGTNFVPFGHGRHAW
jgi:cytochrome P450